LNFPSSQVPLAAVTALEWQGESGDILLRWKPPQSKAMQGGSGRSSPDETSRGASADGLRRPPSRFKSRRSISRLGRLAGNSSQLASQVSLYMNQYC